MRAQRTRRRRFAKRNRSVRPTVRQATRQSIGAPLFVLASESGLSPWVLSRYERGLRELTADESVAYHGALARIAGVTAL